MTSCRDLGNRSPLARFWHRLWCAKCRAARKADGILDRGILTLKSAPPPSDLLTLTMATVGIAPARRRPRSKRWIAVLRRLLLPTEMAALLLAAGWFHYVDLDPQITISVAPLPVYHRSSTDRPSPNALDFYAQAAKIRDQFAPGFFGMGFNSHAKAASARAPMILMNGQLSLWQGDLHHLPRGARLVTEREKYLLELQRNKQLLRQSARKIVLLRKGLKYDYVPPVNGSFGDPAPINFDLIAAPLIAEGEVCEADGDLPAALNSYCDEIQIGVETESCEMEEAATSRLWKLVDRLSAAQARTAVHRMEHILKLHIPLADRLLAHKRAALAGLMQRFRDPHWRIWRRYMWRQSYYKAKAQPDAWSPEDMIAYIQTLPYSKRWITSCYIDQMDRAIADAERPYCFRQILETSGDRRQNSSRAMPLQEDLPELWSTIPEGNDSSYFYATHSEMQESLLLVAFALHVYRQEHGSYPANLNALAPTTLAALPTDPFNGQPMHYHLADAKYVLYSVGPDGKDDNGAPIDQLSPAKLQINAMDQATFATHGRYLTTPQSRGDIVAGLNTRSGRDNR